MATIYRNAHLLDPTQGIDGRGDVLIENGKVVGILQEDFAKGKIVPILVPNWDTQIIDLQGAYLTPGWIDLNTYILSTIGNFCLPVDDVGFRSGVTTVADAGTSGILTFDASRRSLMDTAKTRTYAFMDPSLLYIATSDFIAHQLEISTNPRNQDVQRAAAVVEANRDVIVGFNVRPVRRRGESRSPVFDAARTLAEMFSLPLKVQLGQFAQDEMMPPQELLPQLRPGDIVTQCFQPQYGLFDSLGSLLPAAREAIDRGILMDVGYNSTTFSANLASNAIAQGILPNTLSTDLNRSNVGPDGDLAAVMTKFIKLGLSFSQVLERVTSRPAAALKKSQELGSFQPGMAADFTIVKWVDSTLSPDQEPNPTAPTAQLKVCGVCRDGEHIHIERSPFEPEPIATETPVPALV
ncbi:hypothetical protein [Pantanalinema sp. GBBB05]|uniref:hypothetical protein n=1 Tax=Pantanalinema sp. GBBB05 TaxID=2604139 RepID=UPI001D42FB63|nr:amidohydrolase family protein [Pantanalinema sp. GBBB05]